MTYVVALYQMNENIQNLIRRYGAEKIISQLQPFVSSRRQQRIDEVLNNRLLSIQIALEMPADIQNAFAVIRSCDIFGVAKIHIIAPEKILRGMRSISKGAMDWVDIAFYQNRDDFLSEIKLQKIHLAGAVLEATQSVTTLPVTEPICLLLGNEHSGLTSPALSACDWIYHIPMFGMTESLNLSVAAAISLYDLTQRKRLLLEQPGDLTLDARKQYEAHYYLNSVNSQLVNALCREHWELKAGEDHR